MALSTGQEHLAQAVGLIEEMLKALQGEEGAQAEPLAETKRALDGALASLKGLEDTFFLRSNLCVYFTKQLFTAAERSKRALDDLLKGAEAGPSKLNQAAARLAKAAATLADKSQMRDGVTLT